MPLVVDMSSNILSRKFDINKVYLKNDYPLNFTIFYQFQFGLVYAGAQKNIGPSGVTLVIVRDDLIGHALPITPSVFDYAETVKNNSIANTPPTFM